MPVCKSNIICVANGLITRMIKALAVRNQQSMPCLSPHRQTPKTNMPMPAPNAKFDKIPWITTKPEYRNTSVIAVSVSCLQMQQHTCRLHSCIKLSADVPSALEHRLSQGGRPRHTAADPSSCEHLVAQESAPHDCKVCPDCRVGLPDD